MIELRTGRLVLRPHALADFDEVAALWGDPRVTAFIGGRPQGPDESWVRVLRNAGHWALLGYGFWVVREAATGRFVGEAGLMDAHRGFDPPGGPAPEVGWALAPDAQGRGYATEMVGAALAWGDAHLPTAHTWCMIQPENAASIRVAERCGFASAFDTTYRGVATRLFSRPRGGT